MNTSRTQSKRGGYTLLELLVASLSATLLVAGLASAMFLASRTADSTDTTGEAAIQAHAAISDFTADVQLATSFSEISDTAVTFSVPDRNGDDVTETIRYAWSGTKGDPLTRQYNGGAVATVAENVHAFRIEVDSTSLNLLNNPDMESGVGQWAPHGIASLLPDLLNFHGGGQSLLVLGRLLPSSGVEQDITAHVTNGTSFDVNIWVKSALLPMNMQPAIKTVSSVNGTQFHTAGSVNAGGWTSVSATITPYYSGTLTSAHLVLRTTSAIGDFYIDDASLKLSNAGKSQNWIGIRLQVGSNPQAQIESGTILKNEPF